MPFSTNSGSSGGSGAATSIGGQTIVDINKVTTTGSQSCTAANATDTFTKIAHGLVNGDRVLIAGTTVPTGLNAAIVYYIVNKTDDTFQVSLTSGGAAALFTTDGVSVLICKCEEIWSKVINPNAMIYTMYEIVCKQDGSPGARGYFTYDTCWVRVGAGGFNNQTLHSMNTNRIGGSNFNMITGQDAGTNTVKVWVSGINGTSMTWSGYVKYKAIES